MMSYSKSKHIKELAEKVATLQDTLYFRDKVYAAKIRSITALGEMLEKVMNNGSEAAKQFWGPRLMSVNALHDITDTLMSEVEELRLINNHLIDLNRQLQKRVKEDEELIDKLLNQPPPG